MLFLWSIAKFFFSLRLLIRAASAVKRDAYVLGVKLGLLTKK